MLRTPVWGRLAALAISELHAVVGATADGESTMRARFSPLSSIGVALWCERITRKIWSDPTLLARESVRLTVPQERGVGALGSYIFGFAFPLSERTERGSTTKHVHVYGAPLYSTVVLLIPVRTYFSIDVIRVRR